MAENNVGTLNVEMTANTVSLETNLKKAETSIQSNVAATQRLSREQRVAQGEYERLVEKIDPLLGSLRRLDEMQVQLQKHRAQGIVGDEEFLRFASAIEKQRTELIGNQAALQGNAKTARELSFAARNLPAQFTDIAVAIQGGQKPLTILLQQGGQIKDQFGGIGPAFKFFGQYLVGLINPINVAAAALITLAAGYTKGATEAQKFDKVLAETNGTAGVTRDELISMAEALDEVVGTQGKATEVLAQIVATGKLSEGQLLAVAEAAIKLERDLGIAIEETVKQYAEIAKDPVGALEKLSEKYGIVTAEVYKHIASLEEQGFHEAAVIETTELLIDAQDRMAENATKNLTFIQKFWQGIKVVAAETIDAIADVGRPQTLQNQIESITQQLSTRVGLNGEFLSDEEIFALYEARGVLQDQLDIEKLRADVQAEITKRQQEGVAAASKLTKILAEGTTQEEKREAALKELNRNIELVAEAGAPFTQEQIDALVKYTENKFKDAKIPAVSETASEKAIDAATQKYGELLKTLAGGDKLLPSQKALSDFNIELDGIKNKSEELRTKQEKSLLLEEDSIRAILEKNVQLEQEVERRKDVSDLQEKYLKLTRDLNGEGSKTITQTQQQLDLLDKIIEAGKNRGGLGISAEEIAQRQRQIVDQSVKEAPDLSGLNLSHDPLSEVTRETDRARIKLEEWHSEQLKLLEENRKESSELNEMWNERELKLEEEFQAGMARIDQAAVADRARESQKIFDQFAEQAAKNIQSSFADFLFNPFDEGLKGMAKSFIDTLRRMVAETAATNLLQGFVKANSGGGGFLGILAGMFGGARAEGGPVAQGSTYLVGEKGPELFTAKQSGNILSNSDTKTLSDQIGVIYGGARATGGSVRSGTSYLVGENGKELFVPNQDGHIINAEKTAGLMQNSANGETTINVNIDATDPGAEARIRSMIQQEVVPQVLELAVGKTISTLRRPRFS